ncbi:MBL fold metallo-hydrolase (plasmid) [Streptomyces sp. BI20]|uniref:MBL fold metallo-hydrolase n=1 Tax=Streptomyces sp. BI20 TaxID=3403460 RepID=UPI003C76708F
MTPHEPRLHRIAQDTYGYLAHDGTWGRSNAGLVVSGQDALLIDTLFTVHQAHEMLSEIGRRVPTARIHTVINTHGDSDHWWGNQLLPHAEIIASEATRRHMLDDNSLALLDVVAAKAAPPALQAWAERTFAPFDFSGITPTPATRTFRGELTLDVGTRTVHLLEVGPAHTAGDVLVHVPDTNTLYAGDILFVGCHPVIHSGPIDNWITACRRVIDLDPTTIVPGHGPIVGTAEVHHFRDYLERLRDHAHHSHQAGRSVQEAASTLDLGPHAHLHDRERLVINLGVVYHQLDGGDRPDEIALLQQMAEWKG